MYITNTNLGPVTTSPSLSSTASSGGPVSSNAPGLCTGQKKVVCYFPNWTVWRQGEIFVDV